MYLVMVFFYVGGVTATCTSKRDTQPERKVRGEDRAPEGVF